MKYSDHSFPSHISWILSTSLDIQLHTSFLSLSEKTGKFQKNQTILKNENVQETHTNKIYKNTKLETILHKQKTRKI